MNKNILFAGVAFLLTTGTLFAAEKTMVKEAPAPKTMHPSWDVDKDGLNDCEKDGTCDDSVDYSLPRGTDVVSYQENFYKAVNREWLSSNTVDPVYGRISNIVNVTKKVDGEIKAIIDRLNKADKLTDDEQKVIDFYRSYVNIEYRNKIGIAPLKKTIDRVASAKTHDDIATIFAEYQKIGVPTPISLEVNFDKKDSKQLDLTIQQGGVTLAKGKYTAKDDRSQEEMKYYKKYITDILTLAKLDNATKMADDYIKVESELSEIQLNIVNKRELEKVYKVADFKKLDSILSNLNVKKYLEINGVKQSVTFTIEQEEYLKAFNELFTKIDVEVWKNYLIARYIGQYGGSTITAFSDKVLEYKKKMGLVQKGLSIEDEALSVTKQNLGMLLAKLYIKEYFDAKSKQKVKKMIDDILAQYRIKISDSKIFSKKTKEKALIKLDKMAFNIGYPDKWDDYSTLKIDKNDLLGNNIRIKAFHIADDIAMLGKPADDTKWLAHPPQTVNASYSPPTNQFVVMAGILNKPFFDINASDAYNYGGIGMIIAHEIGHGFDDTGSRYDQDGNLVDWWEPEDRAMYAKSTKKLISQADNFEYMPGKYLNGKLEIDEIIGDLNGMVIALAVYEKIIKEQGLDRKASLKEFFTQLSKVWRSKVEPHTLDRLVQQDPHPVGEFRANGVLKNIDTFHEIFETKKGDGMYMEPSKRVKLW